MNNCILATLPSEIIAYILELAGGGMENIGIFARLCRATREKAISVALWLNFSLPAMPNPYGFLSTYGRSLRSLRTVDIGMDSAFCGPGALPDTFRSIEWLSWITRFVGYEVDYTSVTRVFPDLRHLECKILTVPLWRLESSMCQNKISFFYAEEIRCYRDADEYVVLRKEDFADFARTMFPSMKRPPSAAPSDPAVEAESSDALPAGTGKIKRLRLARLGRTRALGGLRNLRVEAPVTRRQLDGLLKLSPGPLTIECTIEGELQDFGPQTKKAWRISRVQRRGSSLLYFSRKRRDNTDICMRGENGGQ